MGLERVFSTLELCSRLHKQTLQYWATLGMVVLFVKITFLDRPLGTMYEVLC
jgi:uncharacterized membrane protein YwaF